MGTLRPLGAATDRLVDSSAHGHFWVSIGRAGEVHRRSRWSRASANVGVKAGTSTLQHPPVYHFTRYHFTRAASAEIAFRWVREMSPREARV